MDTNQDFGSLLNNFSGSGPSDQGDGLGSLLTPRQPQRQVADTPVGGGNVDEFVKSVSPAAQRVAQRLNVPVEAVIGQWGLETGWGKSVIPGTNNLGNIKGRGVAATDNMTGSRDEYRQYGSVDEFADDFTNLVGNGRYKAVSGSRDAQGYFQNLKAAGYAEDPDYVAKGGKAAAMAAEALKRAGVSAPATNTAPDLSKAPKWADVEAKPEFAKLPPEKQAEAKAAYFDYWIAPRAGDRAAELRTKFLTQANTASAPDERGFLQTAGDTARNLAAGVMKIGPTALKGVADVGNMLTGDTVDLGVSKAMQRGMDTIDETVASQKFNQQKKGFEAVMQDDSKGIGDMFAYMLDNPAILVDNTITTIGSMFLPVGAAKGAAVGARAAGLGTAAATKAAVAASIGTSAAQNAGDTFSTLEKQSLEDRYKGAAVSAGVSILMGIATGGGAEGQIAKRLAGELQAGRVGLDVVKQFLKSVGKEAGQEAGEELGNIGGEAVGSLEAPSAVGAAKRTTFAGTLGGIMGGGTHILTGGGSDAEPAPAPAAVTPDGRIEPTFTPEAQSADNIVRELAEQAGVPLETVLPTPPVAQQDVSLTDEGNTATTDQADTTTDQDVQDFAATRYQQLREKQNGSIQTVIGDSGPVDQDMPGVGLSPAEQQELAGLEQANQDPAALRAMYGMNDGALTNEGTTPVQESEADREGRLEREAIQGEQSMPVAQQPADMDIPFNDAPVQPVGTTGEGAGVSQPTQEQPIAETAPVEPVAEQPAAPAKPRTEKERNQQADYSAKWFGSAEKAAKFIADKKIGETHTVVQDGKKFIIAKKEATNGTQADQAQQAETQLPTQEPTATGVAPTTPPASVEAEKLPETDIRLGDKVMVDGKPFTVTQGVDGGIAAESDATDLGDGVSNFETRILRGDDAIRAKIEADKAGLNKPAKPKTEKEAKAKREQAKDPGQQDDTMDDPEMAAYENGLSAGTRAQDVGDLGGKADAPGTRVNGDVERQAADRLEQLHAKMVNITNRNSREGNAKAAVRSVIEELRKAKAVTSVAAVLDGAANGLDKNYSAFADVIREVSDSLGGDLSTKPAETNTSAEPVQKTAESEQFADNKLFTADAVAKARARMKSKLGTLNSGLDPELMVDGVTIAGAYIESGVRSFSAYSKAMIGDFGDKIRPYLRSFYEGVRHYPGLDTTGMSTPAEIDLMEKQGTAEHTKPAPGTEAAVGETVPAPKRTKERKPADLTLRDDFGVKHIDGYDGDGESGSGPVKLAFLKNAQAYMRDVSLKLQDAGFVPHADRKGKPMKAVSVNEAGAAVSGDVTLTMFHPDMQKGVYITIGGSAMRGVVPTTASGVSVMMRVTKAGDPYGGDQNRWIPVNLSSTELADLAVKTVEQVATRAAQSTVAKPTTQEQNEPKERTQDADTATDEATPASGPAPAGDKRTSVDLAGGKPSQVQGAGGRGQAAADAGKPEVKPAASERVSDRPTDAAPKPDGKAADGRTAADTVATNFTITDELNFAGQGAKTKYANNVSAIRLLKQLEAEGRQATAAEQTTLAKYIGWGGMPQAFDPKNDKWAKEFAELKELLTAAEYATAASSTRNAHYTAAPVVEAIWAGVSRLGFKNGSVLEPSMGSGNFFGLMPDYARSKSRLFGVEFDHITGGIAKQLYPQAKVNAPIGFQDIKLAPESFDLAIGNPPFGSEQLYDKNHTEASKFKIHGFFFAKSVETLKPGGVLGMVVSKGLMDANDAQGKAARAWLAERTRLLGAIRLPNSAFQENANTEVTTDIIFLQKLSEDVKPNASEWDAMGEVTDKATGQPIAINKYFVANPGMMLGEMTLAGSMYRANEPTLTARAGDNLPELLAKAIEKLPKGVFKTGKASFVEAGQKANSVATADDVREYGHFIKDGKLFQRMPDLNGERQSVPIAKEGKELERITGMIGLRDLVRKQLALEKSATSTDAAIEANRAALNKAYDDFQKKYGYLNSQTNKRLFADDSDAALVLSLEGKFDKGVTEAVAKTTGQKPRQAKATKATIFEKRVQTPVAMVSKANTAKEAMLASLNERGGIDLDFMADLYGKSQDEIVAELGDLVFEAPGTGWMPADLYLSGNVKAALAVAKDAAQKDARFQRNVAALMAVQPADINPSDIFVKIGSPWVAVSDYNDFVKATFGGKVAGSFMPSTGNWSVEVTAGTPTENNTTFGTSRMGAHRIVETLMGNKQVAVYDEYRDADGNTKRILNADETAAAQGKADALAEAFQDWIWADNDRRERLSRSYNDTYNTNVKRAYDGSHLTLPGMNPAVSLRPHQLNWVYRSLVEGKGLADHVVGAGKTYAIIASMMEMRRLGLANKPMIVVPNHLVGQWAKDIMALYPGANVLAASRKDFGKDRRKLLFSRIATGDWDMVVVAHSSFGRIPVPAETEKKILDDQLKELVDAIQQAKADKGARFTVKDLERSKTRIEEKLKKLADRSQDNALDFADLGIDALAVDEAHEFKNLFYTTTMQGVAGLGSPTGSTRAFDMFVKTRYVSERAGGKNVFFATGTPVANSIAEVFHMQRFLQYDTLKARGIHNFDAWANTFAMAVSSWEQNAAGKYVQKTAFRTFANLPELKGIWGEVADTITRADLIADAEKQGKRFPLPKVKGGKPQNVVTERSPLQAEFIGIPQQEKDKDGNLKLDDNGQPVMTFKPGTIVYRLENWKEASKQNPKEIPLAITGQARKAGLDYRLIDENAPDFGGSKINAAVSSIFDTWKANDSRKGTQLVFCDLSVPASAKGQATADAAEKVPTFFVKDGQNIKHVAGKPLTLAALPDIEVFSHKDGKRWVITERTSGMKFADGATKQEAIDAANARAARVDTKWLQEKITENAIQQEQIDDYMARWEEQQAQAEDNGSDEDSAEPAKEISMDEMLADTGGSFSVYDDIKAKLIAKGMPAEQIAFIHDYNTDDKKAALFAAVKAGEVRVLMGSTQKMGAGTNVQDKLVALHHMDAPWRPADLEQREGRIIRQGNEFYEADPDGFEVAIYRYATKQTYDSRMWEIIENKARAIEQFKASTDLREIEDVGSESANAAEMKAGASGNPLILEEITLRTGLRKLQAMKKSWERSRFDLEKKIQQATNKTGWVYNAAKMAEEFAAKVQPKNKDALGLKVFGQTINTEKDIKTEELASKMMAAADSAEGKLAGTYRGATIYVRRDHAGVTLFTNHRDYTVSTTTYGPNDKFSVSGFITRMDNLADGAAKWKDSTTQAVVQFEKDAENAKKELARGFPKDAELKSVSDKHKAVVAALRAGKTSLDDTAKPTMASTNIGDSNDGTGAPRGRVFGASGLRPTDRPANEALMREAGQSLGEFDGLAIAADIQREGTLALVGRRIEGARELAAAAQVYRNPVFETSRVVFVRSGTVVFETGVTSRLPGITATVPGTMGEREFYNWLKDQKERLKADGYWMMHNHPSGNPEPSPEDRRDTPRFASNVPGFLGHVIINSNKFAVIHPDKTEEVTTHYFGEERLLRASKPHHALNKKLGDYDDVAELGKSLQKDGYVTLIGTASGIVRAVYSLPLAKYMNPETAKMVTRYVAEKAGASQVFAIGDGILDAPHNEELIRKSFVALVIDSKGNTFGEETPRQAAMQYGVDANESADVQTSDDKPIFRSGGDIVRRIQNNAIQFWGNRDKTPSLKTFGAYDKTLATQFHKALKDKHFGKVFAYVNAMQNEVSLTSIRPAELAPGVLPRVDDVKSAFKQLVKGKKADKNLEVAAQAIFEGTLQEPTNVMAGKVWTQAEFMARPGATEAAWGLYQQSRAAIDASLDEVAAAEAYAMAQGFVPKGMRRQIIDNPSQAEGLVLGEINRQIKTLDKAIKAAARMGADQQEAELKAAREGYVSTRRQVEKIFVTAKNLKASGYAPLMRFGKFTVTVQAMDPTTGLVARDENGESITLFYGQYETEGEAKAVRAQMEARYEGQDDVRIKAGTKSQTSHELYSGISPETLALFADAIGADQAMRKHIELAMSERSALKRRLERKGTAGYSSDMPRVLSNFITSNGRHAAQRYYLRDLNNAIKYIPKEKGDVLDEAMRLKKFVMNPSDPAAPVSSIMFAWFLGGSVASAMVNLSQPIMMTGPYLSQFGVKTATKSLAEALPYALGKKEITDTGMRDALKRASQEGIVDAQEIFHLYSVGAQGVASGLVNTLSRLPGVGGKIKAGSEDARARINAFLTLWGSMFSLAEGFNRKLTFIAAYKVAQANGEKNAYQFAVRAVNETQGIYNKVNRPNWAQGPVGRTVLTFKQFSIMYVELLSRMVKKGGPEGKRAALIMLATLMLAAGEEGLPFAQDLDDLIDTLGQLLGYDTNMKRWKRRHAHEIMGKELGDLFLYGISSQLPLDFAGRLGMGNLIPGTGLLKPSTGENQARDVAEVFGPAAGLISQVADAYGAAVEGNMGKALQNLAPTAVKNALAGAEMAAKGYATDTKGRKVIEVDGVDAAFKSIGFQPTQVARETRKTTPVYQDLALQKRMESSIVAQWAQALAEGDNKAAQKQQQRLTDWNSDNPDTPIRITPDQIRNKARQLATEKDTRLLKMVPREMRGRVGLDLVD